MNAFKYAQKMEMDGIKFYQDQAAGTTHSGFKKILELLIHQERKHYDYFVALEKQAKVEMMPEFPAREAENIFHQLRKQNEGFDFSSEEINAYEKALEIEKRSEDFYRKWARGVQDETLKKQILMVADEEQKHVILVNELVTYINRPSQWVEHAMFSQLREEY
jgi:rubrerythrin